MSGRPVSRVRTWRGPLLAAASVALGLTCGLLGDGFYDWLACLALAAPLVAATVFWLTGAGTAERDAA